ncbi:MAG: hypothetical protein ACYDHZ_00565 [Dehalococcoidia bacterium]
MYHIAFGFVFLLGLCAGLILAFVLGSRAERPDKQESFDELNRRIVADMVKEEKSE